VKDRFDSLRFWQRPGDSRRAGVFASANARRWALASGLSLVAAAGGWLWLASVPGIPGAPFSAVSSALDARRVSEVVVSGGGTHLLVTFRAPASGAGRVSVELPQGVLTLADLDRWTAGATVRVDRASGAGDPAEQGLALLVVSLLLFGAYRLRRGPLGSRRFRTAPEDRRLTLADVGGAEEARADLRDVVAFLREPGRFQAMGARCPTGVLLVGPPGTGKTLLARAVAGETGRPVIVASGSEFTEMYVGVGARRVRDLLKQARQKAPCIVFIDEFDSLGGRRGRPNRSGEEESTLNQLLVEMDGLSGSEGIVWMAATNREDMLDPAVRRPGRFDRVVEVGMPTTADRLSILRIHAASRPLAADVDLGRLAALTVGYSGADLANLLNEATIFAVHAGGSEVAAAHVEQARDKIMLGRLRSGVVVPEGERRVVALHEAGHVIAGLVACPEDRLHKVTIEPRGRSLGAAHFAPDTERHLYSRRYLEGALVKALGGRAAETVLLGSDAITSGAGADLIQATRTARQMVAELGMSDEVGLLSAAPAAQDGAPSAHLQGEIDGAVRSLLGRQMQRAEAIVRDHRAAVEAVAAALLRHEVLDAHDVLAIAALHGVPLDLPDDDELVAA
jgi:cell division protease FtsH